MDVSEGVRDASGQALVVRTVLVIPGAVSLTRVPCVYSRLRERLEWGSEADRSVVGFEGRVRSQAIRGCLCDLGIF